VARQRQCVWQWAAISCLAILLPSISYADEAQMVRIAWGGGPEEFWGGSIGVSRGTISQSRPLGIEADEPGSMWLEDGELRVRQRSPRTYDGVDIVVTAPADARLIVKLAAKNESQHKPPIEIPLTDITSEFRNVPLDDHENRLLVRRAPGDTLLVRTARLSMVFSPGETTRFEVVPHLLPVPVDSRLEIKARLFDSQERQLWSSGQEVRAGNGEIVPVEMTLPENEGVYDFVITAQQNAGWARALRPSLHWKRSIAERRVQLVVISRQPAAVQTARELSPVLEINPANSRWWEQVKWPALPRFSRGPAGPLGNGSRETIHHPLGDISQLRPSAKSPDLSWEAYTLSVTPPGRPYVLEVEYPSDVPQTLGLSILEINAAGSMVPIGLDSGIDVSDETALSTASHWERHRLVFWPRTNSPLLLITNRREGTPAVYGKIRVLGGWERLPPAGTVQKRGSQRLIAAYMDRPLLAENFSAEETLDAWSGRTLQDWKTFYHAGARLVDYLHYAGYNGLVLSVAADGSAIYPSQLLEPTPRYDTGVFFASGQDPMPKDVLEMLLRLMDRENLQFIPAMEFATPLPALEAILRRGGAEARGLEWIGADGGTWRQTCSPRRGLAPYYNTLDPRVQDAMLAAVQELVRRYATHASFRGLALRLSVYGYAQLPGPDWGMDDATITRFEHATGIQVPGRHDDEKRFAARAAFLASNPQRGRWLQWRAAECHKFYHRIQDVLSSARANMPLYLVGAEMLTGPEIEAELRPALPRRSSLALAFLQAGIDLRLFRDDAHVVLLRPQRIMPATQLTAQAMDLELAQMSEAALFFRSLPQSGSVFFHPPQEARIPSFDQKVAIKSSGVLLLTQTVPSGAQNRERFTDSLAAHDAQILIDGGWMVPLGQEEATRRFATAFRQLPNVHFHDAEESHAGQPVVFRWASSEGKTCAYALNTTPYPVSAQVRVNASPNCSIDDLGGNGRPGQLKNDGDGLVWVTELEPYGMLAGCFSEPDAKLIQPQSSLPANVSGSIAQQIRLLGARVVSLRNPPLLKVLENADFQAKPSDADPLPGWAISKRLGVSLTTDTTLGHVTDPAGKGVSNRLCDDQRCASVPASRPFRQTVADTFSGSKGAQSARIFSSGPIACLVSQPFAPPRTGRITMSIWLRVADSARQPNLRLAVQGKLVGRDYYRYAVIGHSQTTGEEIQPLSTDWHQYIVQFDDLPLDGLSLLRVRLDLMGAGEVWADDVQLFDLAFNESELRTLHKLLMLADLNLQNGQIADCLKLLNGYWPRFLMLNVPSPHVVPALATQPASPPPADDKPAEAQRSSWTDRVKGVLPDKWW
jgi:hypothetical protein